MFPPDLIEKARQVITLLHHRKLRLATAESCTGGLVAACLTEIPGCSDVFDRGFVTYSNEAKHALLGVPNDFFHKVGAVSEEVSIAMAEGALRSSDADVAVSCTGIAGPGGESPTKPIGLVHLACAARGCKTIHRRREFGAVGRTNIRLQTVRAAFELIEIQQANPGAGI